MFTRKAIIRLLIPLIIEQLLSVLVGMVDVVMVSSVGETAVSGVSLVDSISMLIIQMLSALATGGSVVCAQYIGKKDQEKACHAAGQLLIVTTLVSSVVALVSLVGNRALLGLIFGQVERAVMDNAALYFWISALSYPFLAVYNSCAALYRAMGNSRISMNVSIAMNAMNVIGNAICIYGLHMGVEGVAIPTLLSRAFAAVMMLVLIQRPQNMVRIRNFKALYWDKKMVRSILQIGIPNGMENTMFQFGKLFLQSLVSSLGTVAIAGYAVASNLVRFEYLPGSAIGLGLVTIVGQCVGAGEWEQAKAYTKQLIRLNYIFLLFICTGMILFRDPIIGIYNLSPEASAAAADLVFAHSLASAMWPVAFTLPFALRASNDAAFTMYISVGSMWIFRIGFAYLFVVVMGHDVLWIWYAMFIDWVFRTIVFVWRFRTFGIRRKITV